MPIRPSTPADHEAIWAILEPVFSAGESYAIDPDISREDALDYWLGTDRVSFVFEQEGAVLGTYYLRTNAGGGGSHVCNCGFITAPAAAGRGIARRMCLHSLDQARACGYRAMQFNFVVATNTRAIDLWQTLGFATVGTLPGAFNHPRHGMVDALVMYQSL